MAIFSYGTTERALWRQGSGTYRILSPWCIWKSMVSPVFSRYIIGEESWYPNPSARPDSCVECAKPLRDNELCSLEHDQFRYQDNWNLPLVVITGQWISRCNLHHSDVRKLPIAQITQLVAWHSLNSICSKAVRYTKKRDKLIVLLWFWRNRPTIHLLTTELGKIFCPLRKSGFLCYFLILITKTILIWNTHCSQRIFFHRLMFWVASDVSVAFPFQYSQSPYPYMDIGLHRTRVLHAG
jgi:hypothetical protein